MGFDMSASLQLTLSEPSAIFKYNVPAPDLAWKISASQIMERVMAVSGPSLLSYLMLLDWYQARMKGRGWATSFWTT